MSDTQTQDTEAINTVAVRMSLKYGTPERVVKDLLRYSVLRIPAGGFLQAVLENNLREACGRADDFNRERLFEIVSFIYNELPSQCWGSPAKVKAWLEGDSDAN